MTPTTLTIKRSQTETETETTGTDRRRHEPQPTLRLGPSFALEKTTTASPADLVVAAYTAAIAAKGAGTGACRMLAVGKGGLPLH